MEGINQEKKQKAQVALSEKYQTPKTIVIVSTVVIYKRKKKRWKCGIIVNHKHLIYECPEMDHWGMDVLKNLNVHEIDELSKGLYLNIESRINWKEYLIEEIVMAFEAKLRDFL